MKAAKRVEFKKRVHVTPLSHLRAVDWAVEFIFRTASWEARGLYNYVNKLK